MMIRADPRNFRRQGTFVTLIGLAFLLIYKMRETFGTTEHSTPPLVESAALIEIALVTGIIVCGALAFSLALIVSFAAALRTFLSGRTGSKDPDPTSVSLYERETERQSEPDVQAEAMPGNIITFPVQFAESER